jgi:hypothetical protein
MRITISRHRALPVLCAGLLACGGAAALCANTSPPAPPHLDFAFEELVLLGKAVTPGRTPYGARNMIPITGGTFEGPGIKGTIVPGGWDWQLARADGCTDVHADYMLKTDDGAIINVVNDGALCMPQPGEAPRPVRTSPRFEAPLGKYQWLGQTAFIGTLEMVSGPKGEPAVRIRFYKAG